MKHKVNKQVAQSKNKMSPQKEKKRIVRRKEPSEDEHSSGYDSEDNVGSRPQQDYTSQQPRDAVTVLNLGEMVPAGIDPDTGNPLFTVQMPQELAAAMASLPAGTRITGLPGIVPLPVPPPQQAATAPSPSPTRQVFIPFPTAVTQQNAVAYGSAVASDLSQNSTQLQYNSMMNNLAATLNNNQALAQSIFQAMAAQQAGLQTQSQLPSSGTSVLPSGAQDSAVQEE